MSQALLIDEIVRRIMNNRGSIPDELVPDIAQSDIEELVRLLAAERYTHISIAAIGELLSLPENMGEEKFKSIATVACDEYESRRNTVCSDNACKHVISIAFQVNPQMVTWLVTTWPNSAGSIAYHAVDRDRYNKNTKMIDGLIKYLSWETIFPEGGTSEEFQDSVLRKIMEAIEPSRVISEILPRIPWAIVSVATERRCSPIELARAFPQYIEQIVLEMPDWALDIAKELPNYAGKIASVSTADQFSHILASFSGHPERQEMIIEALVARRMKEGK